MDDSGSRFLGDYDERYKEKRSQVQGLVFCFSGVFLSLCFFQKSFAESAASLESVVGAYAPSQPLPFEPKIVTSSVQVSLQGQALRAGFSLQEAEVLASSAAQRAAVTKSLTPQEVMDHYVRTGRRVSNLAERRSLSFRDFWTFPRMNVLTVSERLAVVKLAGQAATRSEISKKPSLISEVAIDAHMLQKRWPSMSADEAITRALHAQKEMNLPRGGLTSFGQIAGAGLLARVIVDGYRFQKPIDMIMRDTISEDVIPSAVFAGSEQVTYMLTYRRLMEGSVPTVFLKTSQVLVPLAAAFFVADALWHRKGEMYDVMKRHANRAGLSADPALWVDLTRAILHDQEYDFAGGFLIFGSVLLPAAYVEESAAVASSISSGGVLARLGLAMRSYPIVSSLAIGAAYVGWMAGRPIYEKNRYNDNQKQAANYWDEHIGNNPTRDSFWLKGQRMFSRGIDLLSLHTVTGKVVETNSKRYALQKFFERRDAAYGYWIHQMEEVRSQFSEYWDSHKKNIEAATIGSHCYQATQIAVNGGGRGDVDAYIRRKYARSVLSAGHPDLEGVSYSQIVTVAQKNRKTVNDYLQDRYATSDIQVSETDSYEQQLDKECLLYLQHVSPANFKEKKALEGRLVSLELDANLRWADFLTQPQGVSGWTKKIQAVTRDSLQKINGLVEEETSILRQNSKKGDSSEQSMILDRLTHLNTVYRGISEIRSVI